MPLTKKGKEIMKSMKEQYGTKKGEEVFYASKNKGTIKGVEKASEGKMMTFRQFVKKMSGEQISDKEAQRLKTSYIKKIADSQISEKEAQRLLKQVPKMKKGKMARVKAVKAGLEKASKLHAAQAKTLGTVLKAAGGNMMMKRPMMAKVGVMVGRDTAKKLKEARKRRKADVIKGMGGYMGGGLKEATKKLKAQGYKGGNMALKKIPEGPKGEGLRKLKAERPDVTRKMGFAKKGKVIKAGLGTMALTSKKGRELAKKSVKARMKISPSLNYLSRDNGGSVKSTRGFGAARTSGSGLQDEKLIPGKSLDYYKDLM